VFLGTKHDLGHGLLLLCERRGTSEELNFQKRTLQIRQKRAVRFEVLMEVCIKVVWAVQLCTILSRCLHLK